MGNSSSRQNRLSHKNPYKQGQVCHKMDCSRPKTETPGLSKVDLKFLVRVTNETPEKITALFEKFHKNSKNGYLNKTEFKKLYTELRPEPPERLDKISEFVFNAFCVENDEKLSFDEFAVKHFNVVFHRIISLNLIVC